MLLFPPRFHISKLIPTRYFQTAALSRGKAATILRQMLVERTTHTHRIHLRKKEQLDKTLKGLCLTGRLKEAVGLLCRSGLQLHSKTYALLLQECKQRKDYAKSKRIHAHMLLLGYPPNHFLTVKLLILYALSGDLHTARFLFSTLQSTDDLIPWNAMISGYVQKGLVQQALSIYYDMRHNGILPDQYTFASVFRACSALASLQHGMRAHAVLIKHPFQSNIIVNSALVDMYSKCSCLSDAHKVFDQLSIRNVVIWTSLMSGYGFHGQVYEVLKCFHMMKQQGCRPNSVTFLVLLTACSHGGLVDQGQEHFESMKRDYGVEPEGQHYAAVVDMLGRAGRLQEAYEFVIKSPWKKHAPVWGSLLGACRTYGNVKLLQLAATRYFELEPGNGGNYVVFANGYTSCGLLDAASNVRKRMDKAGVMKDPGYSQIEIQGEVHRFMKDDKSHELCGKIYKTAQEMTSVLMEAKYFYPDIDIDANCTI